MYKDIKKFNNNKYNKNWNFSKYYFFKNLHLQWFLDVFLSKWFLQLSQLNPFWYFFDMQDFTKTSLWFFKQNIFLKKFFLANINEIIIELKNNKLIQLILINYKIIFDGKCANGWSHWSNQCKWRKFNWYFFWRFPRLFVFVNVYYFFLISCFSFLFRCWKFN